jgi:hypothetical protein
VVEQYLCVTLGGFVEAVAGGAWPIAAEPLVSAADSVVVSSGGASHESAPTVDTINSSTTPVTRERSRMGSTSSPL